MRACTGGTIALAESDEYPLEGRLPDGQPYAARVRVTRAPALVMLKLLALFNRYHNIRGPAEARHDREEAQTHATDIVAIVKARPDWAEFRRQFEAQFAADAESGKRVSQILNDFFRERCAGISSLRGISGGDSACRRYDPGGDSGRERACASYFAENPA